jgi:hypothetical protein
MFSAGLIFHKGFVGPILGLGLHTQMTGITGLEFHTCKKHVKNDNFLFNSIGMKQL